MSSVGTGVTGLVGSIGAAPVQVKGFDQQLVWVTLALMLWGLVMVSGGVLAGRFEGAGE